MLEGALIDWQQPHTIHDAVMGAENDLQALFEECVQLRMYLEKLLEHQNAVNISDLIPPDQDLETSLPRMLVGNFFEEKVTVEEIAAMHRVQLCIFKNRVSYLLKAILDGDIDALVPLLRLDSNGEIGDGFLEGQLALGIEQEKINAQKRAIHS